MYRGSLSSRMPYGGHVILLFTFTFAALILSILITFSSPFISSINFLYLPSTSGSTTFGSFGWCSAGYCLQNQVAYEHHLHHLHRPRHPPLLFIHESRALRYVGNRAFFTYASDLSAILVGMAWLFSVYGWSIAHRAFEMAGTEVRMGPAIWMGLTASLLMLIIILLSWPRDAWDGTATLASGGTGRGLPVPPGNGYYHHKRTTREVVPRY
ncbi:hypothetical protein EHS25_009354 [Saitozyma podzolica]|uniref:Uncharacterized protein n=1 Tax=Saitozyma podzolica TaxID=1890683 RepID=A0A427YLM2_9TREE|nr:hypothetical protein EHS25_009354 [Saitozyma podzolica]